MQIIIVLLATIVAFLFGGPFAGIAALLIGLVIVFPNVFGIVAAVVGLIIISVKFDIEPITLILIILGILGILAIVVFSLLGTATEEQRREAIIRSKKRLDAIGVEYSLVKDENKIKKYAITPNTGESWRVLEHLVFNYGKLNSYSNSDTDTDKDLFKMERESDNSKMSLTRDKSKIYLAFENTKILPNFILDKKKKEGIISMEDNNINKNINSKGNVNHINDLVNLSNLLKEGLITEDEYQKEKNKLLK